MADLVVTAPNHGCETPDINEEAAWALGGSSRRGRMYWTCPVCGSRWRGERKFNKRGGEWRYYVEWERIERSKWRWRRAEAKRIRALVAAVDGRNE